MKPTDERRPSDLDDLLAEYSLFGTADAELAALSEEQKDSVSAQKFEQLASLVMAAQVAPTERLPDGWMERLANRFDAESLKLTSSSASGSTPNSESIVTPQSNRTLPISKPMVASQATNTKRMIGWGLAIVATAASFALGVVLGRWSETPRAIATRETPSLSERYREIVSLADTTRVDWKPNADGQVSGYVVWNDRLQTGFMAFDSLPVNDPKIEQYQLWIFDAARDDAQPVDGGVFDFALAQSEQIDGKTLVPIDAKLQVTRAKMFALTVEAPGGVVVSGRERLPGLAIVP